jgi:hypothetical protein
MEAVRLRGAATGRGLTRLAEHCILLEQLAWSTRGTARERLGVALGDDLARRLVDALVAGDPPRAALDLC